MVRWREWAGRATGTTVIDRRVLEGAGGGSPTTDYQQRTTDKKKMGRSLKKGPYVVERLLERVYKADQTGNREPIRTWARACTIVPEFVGHTFMVHNGKTHLKVFITEDMVGHRLGEFAPTRSFRGHGGKGKSTEKAGGPSAPPSKG